MAQLDMIDLRLGHPFDMFMSSGDDDERMAIEDRLESITLPHGIVGIDALDGITLVAFASIWCPDCVVAVPFVELIGRVRPNIKTLYFEREDDGMRDLAVALSGSCSIPLIFAADDEGHVKSGYFVERAARFKSIADAAREKDRAELIRSYRAGEYDGMVSEEIAELLASASR